MSREGFPVHEDGNENCVFHWSYPDGHVDPYAVGSVYTAHAADKIGVNSPGWPAFKQENDYTAWSVTTRATSCRLTGSSASDGGVVDGTYPVVYATGITAPEDIFANYNYLVNNCKMIVQTKLIKQIKGQKINALQALAEYKKTAQTIAETAARIAEAYAQVRRGKIGSGLYTLLGGRDNSGGSSGRNKDKRKNRFIPPNSGSAAKDWLAIQYGWKPLLSDIYGACQELADALTYNPPAGSAFATGSLKEKTSWVQSAGGVFPDTTVTVEFQVSVKGRIEYYVSDQLAASAANMGITNPLAVAWELVPFSFVADWFIPIGSFLSNLDYHNGLVFGKGFMAAKTKGTVTAVPSSAPVTSGGLTLSFSGGSLSCEGTGYERDILGEFPSVPPPQFKDPVSLDHALNALALVRTVLSDGSYTFAR